MKELLIDSPSPKPQAPSPKPQANFVGWRCSTPLVLVAVIVFVPADTALAEIEIKGYVRGGFATFDAEADINEFDGADAQTRLQEATTARETLFLRDDALRAAGVARDGAAADLQMARDRLSQSEAALATAQAAVLTAQGILAQKNVELTAAHANRAVAQAAVLSAQGILAQRNVELTAARANRATAQAAVQSAQTTLTQKDTALADAISRRGMASSEVRRTNTALTEANERYAEALARTVNAGTEYALAQITASEAADEVQEKVMMEAAPRAEAMTAQAALDQGEASLAASTIDTNAKRALATSAATAVTRAQREANNKRAALARAQRAYDAATGINRFRLLAPLLTAQSENGVAQAALVTANAQKTTADTALAMAEATLATAQANVDSLRTTRDTKDAVLATAQSATSTARDAQAEADMAARTAERARAAAQEAERVAQGQQAAATTAAGDAQSALSAAETGLTTAQSEQAAATTAAGEAQSALSAAETGLTTAQSEQAVATTAAGEAQSDLSDAQTNERTTQAEVGEAERELSVAQDGQSDAQDENTMARDAEDQAGTNAEDANEAVRAAEAAEAAAWEAERAARATAQTTLDRRIFAGFGAETSQDKDRRALLESEVTVTASHQSDAGLLIAANLHLAAGSSSRSDTFAALSARLGWRGFQLDLGRTGGAIETLPNLYGYEPGLTEFLSQNSGIDFAFDDDSEHNSIQARYTFEGNGAADVSVALSWSDDHKGGEYNGRFEDSEQLGVSITSVVDNLTFALGYVQAEAELGSGFAAQADTLGLQTRDSYESRLLVATVHADLGRFGVTAMIGDERHDADPDAMYFDKFYGFSANYALSDRADLTFSLGDGLAIFDRREIGLGFAYDLGPSGATLKAGIGHSRVDGSIDGLRLKSDDVVADVGLQFTF